MIIDARNLNLNNFTANNPKVANTSQAKTEELVRNLDKAEGSLFIRQDSLENLVNQSAGKTDTYTADNGYLDVSQIKIVRLKTHYEQGFYTADKALSNAWLASSQNSSLSIRECGSKVSDEAVADMSKSEFLDYVRENGLDKEIDWSAAEYAFRGEKNYQNFSEFTDYCAAFCASLEDRIKSDFSGDEQKEQLEILYSTFDSAIKDFADQLSESVEYTFGTLGADIDMDKFADSIRQVMYDKKDAYAEFIENNKDYAGLEGSADSWLKRDVNYMTEALRQAYAPADVQSGDSELWSEKDILVIGMMASKFTHEADMHGRGSVFEYQDEENMGLVMALNWLSTQKITEAFDVSDSVKGLVGELFEKYAQSFIDRVNISLERSRNNPIGASASAFKSLDEKAIYAVLDVMKKSYDESGDGEKAIYDTTSFARNTFLAKRQNSEYLSLWRYNSPVEGAMRGQDFWGEFYETNSKSKFGGGMGVIMEGWNNFLNSLENKDDLYSFRPYICGQIVRRTSLSFPLIGGYDNGKYWGFNLEEYVFGSKK